MLKQRRRYHRTRGTAFKSNLLPHSTPFFHNPHEDIRCVTAPVPGTWLKPSWKAKCAFSSLANREDNGCLLASLPSPQALNHPVTHRLPPHHEISRPSRLPLPPPFPWQPTTHHVTPIIPLESARAGGLPDQLTSRMIDGSLLIDRGRPDSHASPPRVKT